MNFNPRLSVRDDKIKFPVMQMEANFNPRLSVRDDRGV